MKKKFGKFLSILLTAVMLVGMLPANALAAEEGIIDSISATVTLPTAGSHPVHTGTPEDSSYTIKNVNFYEFYEENPSKKVDDSDTFEAGKTYRVFVVFTPAEGKEIETTANATINGKSATYWTTIGDGWDSRSFYIDYTVPAAEVTPITSVKVSDVTTPAIGETPNFDITLTMTGAALYENEGYESIVWCKYKPEAEAGENEWEPLNERTAFDEGFYALEIYLKAEDGYKFTDATQFCFDEEALPPWHGAYESCYDLWSEGEYADIYLYFTLGESGTESETYDVTVTTDDKGTASATPTTAKAGYTVTLTATAKEGYEFDKWKVESGSVTLADETKATTRFTMPAETVKVKATFKEKAAESDTKTIKKINIKGITPPVVGKLPVLTGITTDTTGIKLTTLQWLRPDYSYMNDRYTFEPGVTYTFYAGFKVTDGYELADILYVTHDLDGGEIQTINKTSNFVTISYKVSGEVNTYTVSFDANGGSGTMAAATGISGVYTLPACGFTAPSGQQFKAWKVGDNEYAAGKNIYVDANTTVTAVWEKSDALKTPISTINIKGITPPYAGEFPVLTGITTDTPGITLRTPQWLNSENKVMNGRYKFEDGVTYTFFAEFDIDEENYKLATGVTAKHDLPGGVLDTINTYTSPKSVKIQCTAYVAPVNKVTVENGAGDGEYAAGKEVTITADSRSGYRFVKWTSDDVTVHNDKGETTAFIMPEKDVTVTAVYEKVSSGGSGGGGGSTKYKATVKDAENGSVTLSKTNAAKGTTVTITVDPEAGYEVDDVTVVTKSGKEVEVTDKGDGTFTFKMPAEAVSTEVTFKEIVKEEVGEEAAIILTIDSMIAWVYGEYVANDVAPVIRNERTMLPARFVAEALGGVVTWDEAEQKVTIVNGEDTIVIFIGEPFATVNGAPVELDSPAFIENSRTYLPIRFIAENMGATVTWDAADRTVTIVPGE